MQKEQKTNTKEFKGEAVRLLASSQKSQAHIAGELGVADSTLSQWRKDLAEHGNDAFAGSVTRRHEKQSHEHIGERKHSFIERFEGAFAAIAYPSSTATKSMTLSYPKRRRAKRTSSEILESRPWRLKWRARRGTSPSQDGVDGID